VSRGRYLLREPLKIDDSAAFWPPMARLIASSRASRAPSMPTRRCREGSVWQYLVHSSSGRLAPILGSPLREAPGCFSASGPGCKEVRFGDSLFTLRRVGWHLLAIGPIGHLLARTYCPARWAVSKHRPVAFGRFRPCSAFLWMRPLQEEAPISGVTFNERGRTDDDHPCDVNE